MDSEMRDWLRHHYHNAADSGPVSKQMKFSDILEEAKTTHPTINPVQLSQAIHSEFPATTIKRIGKSRTTYVYGLEASLEKNETNEALRARNTELKKKVEELEKRV